MKKLHRKLIFISFALLALPVMALLFALVQISDGLERMFDRLGAWADLPEAQGTWSVKVHMTMENERND